MSARTYPSHPQRTLYAPTPGELVRDLTTGLTGIYMAPGFGKEPTVYLRPRCGGCEWEACAYSIEPATPAP
ncbi:hypothetical protein ACFYNO_33845 [Kitasatospora sp. NPDC006697]|uniref:hypothetical protein n=1 Tax=Kitasatospora sp. NPDC006697 TaxID=3364020 RepID=UPI0036853F44